MILHLRQGDRLAQRDAIKRLADMQYQRNDLDFKRGTFRVRGDVLDIFPAENAESALRISLFDDEVESLQLFDPLTGHLRHRMPRYTVFPSIALRDGAPEGAATRSRRSSSSCAEQQGVLRLADASWSRRSASSSARASTSR